MKGRFSTYAAGPFLIAYLLLLLGSSYVSQQNLRQATGRALLSNLEKGALALSYFYSERTNDLATLSKEKYLGDLLANRPLVPSPSPLISSLRQAFLELTNNKKLGNTPIYLRLLFCGPNGTPLIDVGTASSSQIHWLAPELLQGSQPSLFIIQDDDHIHSIGLFPYYYKKQRLGTLIAVINQEEITRSLIQPRASGNTKYAILMDRQYGLNRGRFTSHYLGQGMLLTESLAADPDDPFVFVQRVPIPATPFVLVASSHKDALGAFLTSRWYLVSLIGLTILVLYTVTIGIRARTHALILKTRVQEAERQKIVLDKKNRHLKEEIQKRLNSEMRLQTLLETIPDLIWLKDPQGVYLSCNQKFERFFGATEKEIIGKTDYDFLDRELADFFREKDLAVMAADCALINEERIIYADDGHEELQETIKTPLRDSKGDLVGVLGIARDITARKIVEEKSHYLSSHDPLTGLYNRRVLEERITEELHRAQRYKRSLSIFMVDLDHFKIINDTYGHQNGDIALCHLAELLELSIRKTDYVARYGGEEFIVVLPETPLLKAVELAERLCEQIGASPIPITSKQSIQITASIGVSCFPEHHHSWEGLIAAADAAMYIAKQAGRNRVKSPLTDHFFFI